MLLAVHIRASPISSPKSLLNQVFGKSQNVYPTVPLKRSQFFFITLKTLSFVAINEGGFRLPRNNLSL
jgi:hypothetical protein